MPRSLARRALLASCAAFLATQPIAVAGAAVRAANPTPYTVAYEGFGSTVLVGVDCPTTQLCLAIGHQPEPQYAPYNWLARYSMLYRSTDGGTTWAPLAVPGGDDSNYVDGDQSLGVSCASATFCVLEYATSFGDFEVRVFEVSRDGGATWRYVNSNLSGVGTTPAAGHAQSSNWSPLQDFSCVGVSTCVGILDGEVVSTTDVSNWVAHPASKGVTAISCTSATRCYVVTSSSSSSGSELRVSSSANRGGTLSSPLLHVSSTSPFNAVPLLSCATATACTLLTSGLSGEVYATTNAGRTWRSHVSPLLPQQATETLECPLPSACTALATELSFPTKIVSVSTADAGATWNNLLLGALGFPGALPSLTCQSSGTCLAALGGRAVDSTPDVQGASATWTQTALGTGQPTLNAVACEASATCLAVGTGEMAVSTDNGASWSEHPDAALAGDTFQSISCPSATTTCLAAGSSGTATPTGLVLVSADSGAHWTTAAVPWEVGSVRDVSCASTTTCLALPGFSSALANVPTFVLRSTDGGSDWSLVQVAPASAGLTISGVQCGSATHCVAVGSAGPNVPLVEVSDDGGATWSSVDPTSGGFAADGAFSGVACTSATDCETGAEATSSTDVYAYGTTDGGMTWTRLGLMLTLEDAGFYGGVTTITGCAAGTCVAVSVDETGPQRPAYYLDLLASTDGGATWVAYQPSYDIYFPIAAAIASDGSLVALGTNLEAGPLLVKGG